MSLTRRGFLIGLPLFLAACSTRTTSSVSMVSAYGPIADEKFPLPGMNTKLIKPHLRRQRVDYETSQSEGTIIVDTPNKTSISSKATARRCGTA